MTSYREFKVFFERPAWMQEAACRGIDTNLFYAEPGDPGRPVDHAKAVCKTCPVQQECLDHVIKIGDMQGVWGGHAPKDRRKLRTGYRKELLQDRGSAQ